MVLGGAVAHVFCVIRERGPTWGYGLIAAVSFAAYLPVFWAGFVWDDAPSLTENPLIQAADGLRRFWFTRQPADYWPATDTMLWIEWRFWGTHALGYHAVNLALHLGACLLLWRVLERLAIPGALLAAVLFAVHPVNVESVAWIAQRKNLLALLGYLLAIYAFVRAEESRERLFPWYPLSLLCFIFALLSKGSVAPLPLVLIGIIGWRRTPTARDWARLSPFFCAAAGFAVLNVWFQTHGAGQIRAATPLARLLGASTAIWFYCGKALWPTRLSFMYPLWHVDPSALRWWLPVAAVAALTLVLIAKSRGDAAGPWRKALFAWGYCGVLLLPALGFADVGFMRYSLVADHYQHLAIIGLLVFAAGFLTRLPVPLVALIVAVLTALSFRQSQTYHDAESLYRATLRLNPGAWVAQDGLGVLLLNRGDNREAAEHFEAALRINPNDSDLAYNAGVALRRSEQGAVALDRFQQAAHLNPSRADAYSGIGLCADALGRKAEAAAAFAQAEALDPRDAEIRTNLGYVLIELGRPADAVTELRSAVRLQPGSANAHLKLALALGLSGQLLEAASEHALGLRLRTSEPAAHP